jgi:hypothetical protein
MESPREPLHLVKLSSFHWKIFDTRTTFIWIIVFFNGHIEQGGILKLWMYVGTNADLLFVEFCNFLQCHIL